MRRILCKAQISPYSRRENLHFRRTKRAGFRYMSECNSECRLLMSWEALGQNRRCLYVGMLVLSLPGSFSLICGLLFLCGQQLMEQRHEKGQGETPLPKMSFPLVLESSSESSPSDVACCVNRSIELLPMVAAACLYRDRRHLVLLNSDSGYNPLTVPATLRPHRRGTYAAFSERRMRPKNLDCTSSSEISKIL